MGDESSKDLFARLRAETEQSKAEVKSMGVTIRAYFEGLVEAGFTEQQAMELTHGFQSALIMGSLGSGGSDEDA